MVYSLIFAFYFAANFVFVASSGGFGLDFFSRTNTANITLPTTRASAEAQGWVLSVRDDLHGNGCRDNLGIEYTEGADTHSKSRPLSLFFEASSAGRLTAFSIRAWFSDDSFYNPNTWQLPPFGVIEDGERWISVTTRDPTKMCKAVQQDDGVLLGDRLLVNVDAHGEGLLVPTIVPSTPNGAWKSGACQSDMSRHWAYPLDGDSHQLYGFDHGVHVYPVIPMYSVPEGDGQGSVTAVAFFTTEAQMTNKEGGIWDATGTASQLCSGNFCLDEDKCEYGEGNSVLHIFFVDQWTDAAQCGSDGSPGCDAYIPY